MSRTIEIELEEESPGITKTESLRPVNVVCQNGHPGQVNLRYAQPPGKVLHTVCIERISETSLCLAPQTVVSG